MWAAFLPRHALVVEMFGADRTAGGERHYHNIASLYDLHHRYLTLPTVGMPNGRQGLRWSQADVDKVVAHIKSTPIFSQVQPS